MKELESISVVCTVRHVGMWMSAKTKDQNMYKSAQALEAEIKKHCDYYEDSHLVSNYVCSDCGYSWEVDMYGVPMCCTKAEIEHLESLKKGVGK